MTTNDATPREADRAVPEPDADAIYRERNQVVAALSKCFYSWIGTVDDAEPGWTKAVYIDLPSGQVSWHVPDHEIPDLFGHLQESGEPWDGHTTEEKYERLAALAAVPTVQAAAGDDLDAMLKDARIVEVSDMDGEYALVRVPVVARIVSMGPVDIDNLKDAVQQASERKEAHDAGSTP